MNAALVYTLKDVLSYVLNSENKNLRRKALEFALELLSEMEMDFTKAEKGLKAEIENKKDDADMWIEKILSDLDKVEYEE
jgi:hypothetical protein